MKTKVKSVSNTGRTFSAHGKDFLVHQYEMEDGTEGQANHTEENKFSVGDEVEYEIKKTHETYGHTLTVKRPDAGFGGGGGYKPRTQSWKESMGITRDACLGAACDYYSKNLSPAQSVKSVEALANRFVAFVAHGTAEEEFEMWGETHKNLIHRNSMVKNAAKVATTEDECIRFAMDFIKYVNQ